MGWLQVRSIQRILRLLHWKIVCGDVPDLRTATSPVLSSTVVRTCGPSALACAKKQSQGTEPEARGRVAYTGCSTRVVRTKRGQHLHFASRSRELGDSAARLQSTDAATVVLTKQRVNLTITTVFQ